MSYNGGERGFTMDKKDEKQGKKCFIITPIGNENSEVFRKAKGVIESTIKPILREYSFTDIKPAYEINVSGMINTQIINRIVNDDLVVANLTGNNPNVMYELCLRHVVAKPIIHICENGTNLPFDIKDSRTIFYENDMLGVEELKNKLRSFMDNLSYTDDYIDNPIYTARKYENLLKETKGTDTNEMLKMLMSISNQISELNNSRSEVILPSNKWEYGQIFPSKAFRDIVLSIDIHEAIDYLENAEEKVDISDVAAALEVPIQVILIIAEMVGVNVKSTNMAITKRQLGRIINYVVTRRD